MITAFILGCIVGAIVATLGWVVWMWHAMNPLREDRP